jgi:hypothetical protein
VGPQTRGEFVLNAEEIDLLMQAVDWPSDK